VGILALNKMREGTERWRAAKCSCAQAEQERGRVRDGKNVRRQRDYVETSRVAQKTPANVQDETNSMQRKQEGVEFKKKGSGWKNSPSTRGLKGGCTIDHTKGKPQDLWNRRT